MRRRLIAAVLAVTASAVAGCAAAQPPHPAVFDRPPNADDTLPADITGYGADTVRLVGDDVEGARYWVARLDDGLPCIIRDPAEGDWMGVCGASGLSGIAQDGTVVEFASDPRELSRETAELVGDTILVRHP